MSVSILLPRVFDTKKFVNEKFPKFSSSTAKFLESLIRVTRLGNLLDFGQLFKAFGNN